MTESHICGLAKSQSELTVYPDTGSGCCCFVASVIDCTLPGCYRSLIYRNVEPIVCLVGEAPLHSPGAIFVDVQTCTGSEWISRERRNAQGFVISPFPTYTLRAFILHVNVVGGSH